MTIPTINGVEYDIKPGANLRNANLRGADLRHADLQGANLQNADLRGANLQNADLRGADLRGANLQGADLQGANLQNADLRGAYLQGANLQHANLQHANLRFADLQGANLRGADLRGADLRNADLRHADLQGANLRGANLLGAYLRGVGLQGVKALYTLGTPPGVGGFYAWKQLQGGTLVKLYIPAGAERTGCYRSRKCRAQRAKVVSFDGEGRSSYHDETFHYPEPGEYVETAPALYNNDPRRECAPGIHFFMSRQEAADYVY